MYPRDLENNLVQLVFNNPSLDFKDNDKVKTFLHDLNLESVHLSFIHVFVKNVSLFSVALMPMWRPIQRLHKQQEQKYDKSGSKCNITSLERLAFFGVKKA